MVPAGAGGWAACTVNVLHAEMRAGVSWTPLFWVTSGGGLPPLATHSAIRRTRLPGLRGKAYVAYVPALVNTSDQPHIIVRFAAVAGALCWASIAVSLRPCSRLTITQQ